MFFGEFIKKRRLELNIEAKELAKRLGLSPPYIVDIEKGRRNPPDEIQLNKIVEILQLSKEDMHIMFDLAAKAKDAVSHDISEYVLEENMARVALRTAKENNLGNEFWETVNNLAKEAGRNNEYDL